MLISVLTDDISLHRKLTLALAGVAELTPFGDGSGELRLCDARQGGRASGSDIAIISRDAWQGEPLTLPYPFTFGELREIVSQAAAGGGARLALNADERCARLDGERIKLTVIEYKLLEAILSGGGEYVSREELIRRVWDGEVQGGVLNVYVHYLREKLELHGEKIIISSRKSGYRIDGKYTGRGNG